MDAISREYTLSGSVSYWNVDRHNLLSLRSLFVFLQEAAIRHADQCGAGAHAKELRGESWVLHRMAASILRYPRYEEALRVVTWSSGIRSFKGFRDFRVYCGDELIVSASSVWLYFSLAAKVVCRVPAEVAAGFPTRTGEEFCPSLEKMRIDSPSGGLPGREISLRYSDYDGNEHVNNTAYFDFLQTALASAGFSPRPRSLQVEFLRAIPPSVESVAVRIEPRGGAVAFSLGHGATLFARGGADCS